MSRRFSAGLIAATALISANASPAGAAVTIGQTFAPSGACATAATYFQQTSLAQKYFAASPGVITMWAFQADSVPPQLLKFKIGRPTGGNGYKIVGTSASVSPAPNTLNTYEIRIPVQAGDQIGFFVGNAACASVAPAGNAIAFFNSDLSPGDPSATFTTQDQRLLDVSARLEPDADNDGFGDETQDCAPNDPDVHSGCRTAALKRCKRLAHKHNWSHKRLRKCKKNANLLPV